jgi:hypothetical protein
MRIRTRSNDVTRWRQIEPLLFALSFWAASSLLATGLCVSTVQAWRRHWWRAAGRVCLTLVCGAAVASIAWLYHWNLLGWRY